MERLFGHDTRIKEVLEQTSFHSRSNRTAEDADRKAEEEYRLFNPTQRIDSDFDKHIRGLFDE